jgi:TetR/AcrR family transcriptional regulator, repressor for divergent bdcA
MAPKADRIGSCCAPAGRGRPRCFDLERGVEVAAQLFREKGYDAVGVAELVRAIGISPPSFYAAYGSKKTLLGLVLERYGRQEGGFVAELACPGRPLAETAEALFVRAVAHYTRDPAARGCLVFEGMRNCTDPEVCTIAREAHDRLRDCLICWLSDGLPGPAAAGLADYMLVVLAGLSSQARDGMPSRVLVEAARIAAQGFRAELEREAPVAQKSNGAAVSRPA